MTPILYDHFERRFITNGIGRLPDMISCTVTEERNGVYELEFQYPITGERYSDIQEGRVVLVSHDETGDLQPFDIYGRSAPLNGIVTFYAHHISYRLADVVVLPFTAASVTDALTQIPEHSANANPFLFWTDKGTVGQYENPAPVECRAMLGGQENSILDVYGSGDYEFDRFTVRLHANRGRDNGVTIRYGKNLTELENKIDTSSSYNAIVPYWLGSDGEMVMLPETMLVYSGSMVYDTNLTDENLVIIRTETNEPIELAEQVIDAAPMDLSSEFQEKPTVDQLRDAATARFNGGEPWLANQNLKVSFVALWQTAEYENYAPLQRVRLCDTVSVIYEKLGVSVKMKVIKTVWNVLLERYDEIELGNPQTTLAEAIGGSVERAILEQVPTYDGVEKMFDLLRGGLGGYVYLKPNANGQPEEILIMDDEDMTKAVNVIRMNRNGIGFSQTGYNGPFNSAWTIDGTFYADWIKAGTLSDVNNRNTWNLITGELITRSLQAREYVYVNGTAASFFKIPYQQNEDYYLQLSSDGLEISVGDSKIRDFVTLHQGSGTTDPFDVDLGGLQFLYEGQDHQWYTSLDPAGFTASHDMEYLLELSCSRLYMQHGNSSLIRLDTYQDAYTMQLGGASLGITGGLVVTGTKSRQVSTESFGDRLLYCYETPTPLFGDIGEAVLDEDGVCFVDTDAIFGETISDRMEYQVFLQKEGPGDCWVASKGSLGFVIEGTPGLKVAWEIKAKQKGYEILRLEEDRGLDEYEREPEDSLFMDYIDEQEDLLYEAVG